MPIRVRRAPRPSGSVAADRRAIAATSLRAARTFGALRGAVAVAAVRAALAATAVLAVPRPALADEGPREAKTELGVVPLVGGDSDVGVGGGQMSSLARVAPGVEPYVWRVESVAMITFKPVAGDVRVPYQDYYLHAIFPGFVGGRLRAEIRPSFTNETTQKYYGLGNASFAPAEGGSAFEYGRMHPTVLARARLALGGGFYVWEGVQLTYNRLDVREGTSLANDRARGGAYVREVLGEPRDHGVALFEHGVAYDDRDDETSPTAGQHHQVKVRLSPGGTRDFPYRYGQATIVLRGYLSPAGRRFGLSLRLVGDALFGDPPFYELARYGEDQFALGGGSGVRGVPAQRYYGKLKVFGNVEARSELFEFHLFGTPVALGVAAFFDAGRLWAGWEPHPELDGDGVGLKVGVGGGLRLRQGKAFVVRADVAWSPDARPVGAYFAAGQLF